MTAREAIEFFSGYKTRIEYAVISGVATMSDIMANDALDLAIAALEKEAWEEEHPVSPLHKSVKKELCTNCAVRMRCESYLDWLKDSWRIAPPRVKGCEKFINDSN